MLTVYVAQCMRSRDIVAKFTNFLDNESVFMAKANSKNVSITLYVNKDY